MLYSLFYFLSSLNVPGARLFRYISFRSVLSFSLSLIISVLIGERIIRFLQRHQAGETIRNLGLEGQIQKKGTPTMGGIIIIIAILIPVLLLARLSNIYVLLMLITTIWLGILGLIDDCIKVIWKHKEGLSGKIKIIAQVGLGLIVGLIVYLSPNIVMYENVEIRQQGGRKTVSYTPPLKSTQTTVPFFKNNNLDYRDLTAFMTNHRTAATWILFVLITVFIVTAVSNGANLTDGLDGLTAGSSAIIGVVLGILAYVSANLGFAAYLNIMYIPGCGELTVFASAFVGACMGFLWHNAFPAQVFMGDIGSLTLGGIIAVFAIIIHKELLLPMLCGIFFTESLSVMIQVAYFKYSKRKTGMGKRIFKMTPIHHHFQKGGSEEVNVIIQKPLNAIPESKIVVRFWLIGILLAALTVVTLKIR
ncbi:MAG: phospho-N-acetylmuramoyl-pentapeptide-transferase [Candidatus Azobacteroides pseudotrichonymphae]|jgi:phospho-N-acetylmuramoyl-pentapeptide-transferase|uniref:Phospho-N-acetylmuramoyl-pentapeptide-transferase n=1 Tax=Azobacteroides pseudotrichonymphae genomovar. CFP2 TaxID=511995 RepID=MRAY_AZOPC|nr:phospho-N-acetylmuramoyl-pentapeptide-transferase [Candidatus Azobacteroides pseudotrichonymphae]B6YS29.1 RecName: Full=Phospho-N-acetylmuramoyl-pentapeptide-transferase; AltName: Full=UDP-MurNAc-pentapeptide phosphotransferase [Candidatus Azobacteroides pseudotrichonymphae genomovar. CFP2]MDR0530434.1 phospho-N-acetylmuramoyl-pentapeptide-transferase [Bacteroidales bacterium OttesenSCG-928-I14]BAG84001.1 phospho-N-acetylmuramoyl-pentapeptide-transferase [Candidatus Azobacteroides pseudotrich